MTLDERLQALTESLELQSAMREDDHKHLEEDRERQFQHEKEMLSLRHDFNRAFDLAVRESRNERQKRREGLSELDTKITQLAAAQLVTEEKLQRLIDAIHPGGNGKS